MEKVVGRTGMQKTDYDELKARAEAVLNRQGPPELTSSMLVKAEDILALIAENERLREGLTKFGHHAHLCEYRHWTAVDARGLTRGDCTCGLTAALQEVQP